MGQSQTKTHTVIQLFTAWPTGETANQFLGIVTSALNVPEGVEYRLYRRRSAVATTVDIWLLAPTGYTE